MQLENEMRKFQEGRLAADRKRADEQHELAEKRKYARRQAECEYQNAQAARNFRRTLATTIFSFIIGGLLTWFLTKKDEPKITIQLLDGIEIKDKPATQN